MAFIDRYRQQIRENVPVVYNGLEFHPLTVRDYGAYSAGKQPYELMLSSLKNPRFARLSWCACLWELDKECEKQTGELGDFLMTALYIMALALRLDADRDGNYPLRPVFSQEGQVNAVAVVNSQVDYTLFNMVQMNDVRQIIAEQNCYDIPNENWNPELVKAAQDNAARGSIDLDFDMEDLVYSVAVQAGCRAKDVYDWTIREFIKTQDAIERKLGYMICSLAEAQGAKYERGNPHPTWKFNRKSDMPAGFRTISDIDAGAKGLIAGT